MAVWCGSQPKQPHVLFRAQMRGYRSARCRKFEPGVRFGSAGEIVSRAPLRRFAQVTNAEFCLDVGKQWRDLGIEFPSNIRRSRRNIAKRWVILIQEFVIKPVAKGSPGALFDFADVDQHAPRWIDGASKYEISNIIAAAAMLRVCFRAKHGQVFLFVPIFDVQPPRSGEFKALTDSE